MPVFALDALPVGDYLVLALLLVGVLLAGLVRLLACLMGGAAEPDPDREHYADDPDQP